jgi:hypothetical protein
LDRYIYGIIGETKVLCREDLCVNVPTFGKAFWPLAFVAFVLSLCKNHINVKKKATWLLQYFRDLARQGLINYFCYCSFTTVNYSNPAVTEECEYLEKKFNQPIICQGDHCVVILISVNYALWIYGQERLRETNNTCSVN